MRTTPFSRRGAWCDVSPVVGLHRTAPDLHLVSHRTAMHPVLRLLPATGEPVTVDATPALLTWRTPGGQVGAAFEDADTLRLRGVGLGMTLQVADPVLTPFTGAYLFRDPADGSHVLTVYETGQRYRVTVLEGEVRATGAEALGQADRGLSLRAGPGGAWEVAVEELETGRSPYVRTRAFDEVVGAAAAEFWAYADAVAGWRDERTPAAVLAAYVLWSATVAPAGFLARETVLMSKHWMDSVWSWDHCFNALALADGLPGHAWDQLLVPFDHQDASGALPDSVAHSRVLRNFVKPPVHGWALRQLLDRAPVGDDDLAACYVALCRWTQYWTDHRTAPGQVLPAYSHGNDSGWDNATVFDDARVVCTGDLAALLALQMRVLGDVATRLSLAEQARAWRQRADELQAAMLRELWDGQRFLPRSPWTGVRSHSRSLLTLVPVVLGADLPEDVVAALADGVREHLTGHGLATEPVDSPHYRSDGYWRGPVWAPSTVLVEDGLRRAGQVELADTVSARFRLLCETHGFAENFDAVSGAGLRDRAYTWTASAYLLLAGAAVARRRAAGAAGGAPGT